ncbi:hypothetical protein SHIRM173S_13299 [Streptomyces hirsutus]
MGQTGEALGAGRRTGHRLRPGAAPAPVRGGLSQLPELAKLVLFSASVLSDAAAGYRLPTLQVALAFAEACGGDRAVWERRWREAAREVGGEGRPDARAVHQGRRRGRGPPYGPCRRRPPSSPWSRGRWPAGPGCWAGRGC